ncbi:MAG: FAD-dependent thymidylate synthase [Dehalococcoidia bacterium]|jgi:thymidylate synthase (FAD)|nr:FAD-dependent thymidylate synthase [Dehalococcoidia bacterium]
MATDASKKARTRRKSSSKNGKPPRLGVEQQAEITAARADTQLTRRATVPALEEILYEPLPVLDHGFVRVIDYMGDDAAIVQAARVSYGRGTKQTREDAGLIRYLMRNWHTSPFEMCELKLHVKLPIFVARQWIRHRTANVNEYSARYSILENEFYLPDRPYLGVQSTTNRQGREAPSFYQLGFEGIAAPPVESKRGSDEVVEGEEAEFVLSTLRDDAQNAFSHYQEMLNEDAEGKRLKKGRRGLARELARMNLSLNFYTQWYWKIDLHNLLHFLRLRADPHAQYEIRAYADVIADRILQHWVPLTHEAFIDYRAGGAQVTQKGLEVIRRLLKGEKVGRKASGMTAADWRELEAVFDLKDD